MPQLRRQRGVDLRFGRVIGLPGEGFQGVEQSLHFAAVLFAEEQLQGVIVRESQSPRNLVTLVDQAQQVRLDRPADFHGWPPTRRGVVGIGRLPQHAANFVGGRRPAGDAGAIHIHRLFDGIGRRQQFVDHGRIELGARYWR